MVEPKRQLFDRESARLAAAAVLVAVLLGLVACAPGTAPGPETDQTSPSASPADTYINHSFVVPFALDPPSWIISVPVPTWATSRYVTWESPGGGPAVRIVAPSSVFRPGSTRRAAVPKDYLAYLLDQQQDGAVFTDRVDRDIGGQPSTVVTATSKKALYGSLACYEPEQQAHDCLGLVPELKLRIAVIPHEKQPLLIWLRDNADIAPDDFASHVARFDAMLDSLTFNPPAAPTSTKPSATGVIDGIWTSTSTRAELVSTADPGEVNDGNWGTFTLDLRDGTGVETMTNDIESYRFDIAYHLDGDVLTVERDNGEHFVMRWKLVDDQLVLARDDALGVVPIPFVLKPLVPAPR